MTAEVEAERAADEPETPSGATRAEEGATAPIADGPVGAPTRSQKRKSKAEKKAAAEATVERPEPVAGAYHVDLPLFAGPLDLLLHLIQQHELDIKDIPMAFISEKYLEYITLMQDLNIDLASEYLVMAATLAHIKSKMLLPKPPVDQDDDAADDMDPRGELVRRLLEYQKYKDAAETLGDGSILGRDVFYRGAPAPSIDGPAPLAQVSVFKLFDAFQKLLSRAKQTAEHLIDVDRISISERIIELTDLLKNKGRTPFEGLFSEESTRSDLIVTFLALLEMTRLRMMVVIQEAPLSPIFVELTLAEEHEEILNRDLSEGDPLAALTRGDYESVSQAEHPVEHVDDSSISPQDPSDDSPVEDPGIDEGRDDWDPEMNEQFETSDSPSEAEKDDPSPAGE